MCTLDAKGKHEQVGGEKMVAEGIALLSSWKRFALTSPKKPLQSLRRREKNEPENNLGDLPTMLSPQRDT